ncbi:MAG: 1-acyl-sn-glycerol-3-phosphate acyltransferase [Desulfuromonas sp.]|nr:1-acyl-sn-glycerol-3-phosphate acyltransferase [Desulfuromonas sp.]
MLTVPLIDGSYKTASNSACWLSSQLPSVSFYSRAFAIVFKAARMAKQDILTDGDWALSSLNTLRALEACGTQIEIAGMEHVTASHEPCVFIGNHMSTLETFVLPTLIAPYRPVTFVIKQSLVDYPIFKHIMRSRNPVIVGRDNPREDLKTVLQQGCERLAQGTSVVVFPQTTRTTEFDPEQFNSIGIKLAKKAGVPIIPLALKTDAWGNGQRIKEFGPIDPDKTVHFEFGAPIDAQGNSRQIQEQLVQFIQEHLKNWTA